MASNRPKATYALISLGCAKNLVDSERMAGLLRNDGYELVAEPAGADFVVVNTCGFIGDARSESHGVIREMAQLKQQGRLRGLIVAGCLAERDRESLLQACPQIDQLIGVFARDEIAAAAGRLMEGGEQEHADLRPAPPCPLPDTDRLRLTPPHIAYLKIAEGCNRWCSFCSIPQMRGGFASKPIEHLLAEAEQLAADGTRELVLIAQDTSSYGLDLYHEPRLAELVTRLGEIEGPAWIRLMYLYPTHITDELIDVVASHEKVVPYLDLPLQHADDEILGRMRRGVTRAETEALLDRLRGRIDSLVLRTTMMTGFPGETDRHFDELVRFVRQQRFERLGVFAFSEEPGTGAVHLDAKVPEQVAESRRGRLMAAQQEIAFEFARRQVGHTMDVLIDRDIPGEDHAYAGRTYADAPEVDGAIYVTGENLTPGQIVACEIVASREYDLIGVSTK